MTHLPEFNACLRKQRGSKGICLWRPGYVKIKWITEIIGLARILVQVRRVTAPENIYEMDFVILPRDNHRKRAPIGRPAQAIVKNSVRKFPAAHRFLDGLHPVHPHFEIAGDIPQQHVSVLTSCRQVTAAGVPGCIPQHAAVPSEYEQWYALDQLVRSRFSRWCVLIVCDGMQKIVQRNAAASKQDGGSHSGSSYEQASPADQVVLHPR